MAVYKLKKINVMSLLKGLPVVFALVGTLIGFFTFFLFPTDIAKELTIGARLLSWLIFIVLYSLLMEVGVVLVSLIYNWVSKVIGGISIELDSM